MIGAAIATVTVLVAPGVATAAAIGLLILATLATGALINGRRRARRSAHHTRHTRPDRSYRA